MYKTPFIPTHVCQNLMLVNNSTFACTGKMLVTVNPTDTFSLKAKRALKFCLH